MDMEAPWAAPTTVVTPQEDPLERIMNLIGQAVSPVVHVTVPPSTVSVASTPALVDVANEMNLDIDGLIAELAANREVLQTCCTALQACIATMMLPVERTVNRGMGNVITSITERRIL